MSSIVASVFLWLFTIGLVSNQPWLIGIAIVLLLTLAALFRKRGASAILLISSGAAVLVLASLNWPINAKLNFDPLVSLRELATSSISGVDANSAALVLGMTVGDDSLVSAQLRDSMQLTSLTHLMAVSGANCAIVIGAVYFLLFKFRTRTRVLISLSALIAYVSLVGLQPSVLRAAVMSVAVMFALVLGRRVNPLSALALSVLVLLCLTPQLSISYGFALSVLATAGILILAPELYRRFSSRIPNWVAMGLAVSAAAQLFCFPVLLGLQGGLPTYSLIANLLSEPLVAPITVLGLIGIVCLWCQPLAGIFFWLASVVAWPISQVALVLSDLPFATLPWRIDGWGVAAGLIAVAAILATIYARKLAAKNLSWLMVAVLLACSCGVIWQQAVRSSLWPMTDWQVASCDVGQGDATVIRNREAIVLIDVGRDEKKIDVCLSKLGVMQISLLVLTHFDADHVNGLAGAIKNRIVDSAMITSFVDERPGANMSKLLLEARGVKTVTAEAGLNGHFGDLNWKVLSPTRTAVEAEDSNDGSVTMLWRFPKFQLITLADLGERGQQRLAAKLGNWWVSPDLPLVMKVSHHGSADQYPELLEWLKPKLSLISVGAGNGYGHPTRRTLNTLARAGSVILRTDLLGSIALKNPNGVFEVSYSGAS